MATIYREGDRGTVVKQIQKALKQSGFGVVDDGIWGPITTEAVTAFQKAMGLKNDGLAGPATLAKLGISTVTQAVTPSKNAQSVVYNGFGGSLSLKKSKRRIDYIVVHCTATPEGQGRTVEQIRSQHKAQGWNDIGYHYVVALDGRVFQGRDVDLAGAHVSGYNAHSIGVVYVGGLENDPKKTYQQLKAKDTRTPQQKQALLGLMAALKRLYPNAKIRGHRDFSPDKNGNGVVEPWEFIKECPSFDAKEEYKSI